MCDCVCNLETKLLVELYNLIEKFDLTKADCSTHDFGRFSEMLIPFNEPLDKDTVFKANEHLANTYFQIQKCESDSNIVHKLPYSVHVFQDHIEIREEAPNFSYIFRELYQYMLTKAKSGNHIKIY